MLLNATPPKVLIVEDEPLLVMDMEAMLEDAGYVIEGEANCLDEVAAMVGHIEPDLALVDMHLAHGSTGLQVCQLLQQQWPRAMVVFVTANTGKVPSDFAGAHGVIAKPFSRSGFTSALSFLLEGLSDPPPKSALPTSFLPSPHLNQMWRA